MIGDPSGRTDMRKMLTREDIDHNAACFRRQMERFIEFGEGKAMMVNNADWLLDLNYVELLREVGTCFSVNNMLRAECYKQRMERGLSFFEFNYMIMQSYDFYYLFQHYGCNMQFGGDDQWSNMLGGTELIRKKLGKDAHAMTITLLTDSNGNKMGKTAGNAVWLDPNKTSPYDFYQYWGNGGDADGIIARRCLPSCPWSRSGRWRSGRTTGSMRKRRSWPTSLRLLSTASRRRTRPRPLPEPCSAAAARGQNCLPRS
jgi:tyrosyl-tRNA synthetase